MRPTPKLTDKLFGQLASAQSRALTRLLDAANESSMRVFLVGGPVRDLLLGLPPGDVDVTVEGDAIALAERVATEEESRVVRHPQFGTATVSGGDWRIDVATARSETYARPGAMPLVRAATIDDDLMRRDFTINALALALNGPAAGKLLDPAGGRADLEAGLVRVLHDRSFEDDGTRILRATRYEARFGFRLEELTHDLLVRDLRYLDTISPGRVHHELTRTLREEAPERALLRLNELGALRALHPSLTFDEEQASSFQRLREAAPRSVPAAYWPLLLWRVPELHVETVAGRLGLTRRQGDAVSALATLRTLSPRLVEARPAVVVALLDGLPVSAVWALVVAAESEGVRTQAATYLMRWRNLRPLLRGDDLPALGVRPGKPVGEVLARLRAAKLDGEAHTRADEERLVREYLARISR